MRPFGGAAILATARRVLTSTEVVGSAPGKIETMSEPTRAEVDALEGDTLLEFGTSWCPHCRAAQPHIAAALKEQPTVRHLKIEDGPGQPLGRSFRVKLWPTLVLLRNGVEVARVVRPPHVGDVAALFMAKSAVSTASS